MSAPAKTEAPAAGAPEAAPAAKGGGGMMPLLLAVVLVPALCFATTQFVLIPKLKAVVAEQGVAAEAGGEVKGGHGAAKGGHGAKGGHAAKGGHGGKGEAEGNNVDFGVVIVNVAGANGSRYLRTNLVLVGDDEKLEEVVKVNQSALRDAAINVLSSQSLAVLDSPGGKNVIRNELMAAFNRSLGGEAVSQIYFSEFVVQ